MKKIGILVAAAALVASMGLFGCSSNTTSASSSSASSSSSAATDTADYTLVTPGVLTIATSPDYPPFESLEGDEYVGFDIELAKAIADELGLTPEFKNLQFDTICTAVAAGGQADIGISGFSVDPERELTIDFTTSYYVDNLSVATMTDNEAITADNAEEALNQTGVIIAVQSGTTGETYVQENFPNATVQPYGNSNDAFAAMSAGQATAVCTNKAVVEKMLTQAYPDAQVVLNIATGEDYAIVSAKDNPNLTAAINEAIATLMANGTVDALIAEYLA